MFILKFLPDWIFYFILLAGLAGIAASFVLKFIPFVSTYRVPILWASGIATAFGLYMSGAISNEQAWLARVADLEKKVAAAEIKSAETNTQLVSKLAQQEKLIATRQTELKTRIQQVAVVMDKECTISSEVVSILNDAAKQGVKK
jgi:hypothetical protein